MTYTPSDIQLVIPMSGLGSRFSREGYKEPKPLIPVQGRPIIEWVLRMFPQSKAPLFICRRQHIEETNMRETLLRLAPDARIEIIDGAKLGPVGALMAAKKAIDDAKPTLVSYCDYYMQWDYAAFCAKMFETKCDGAVPCYTGFHPHLLPAKNLYACCRIDESGWLKEIREKHTFNPDKTKALHSPGAYYFRTGALLKTYSQKLIDSGDDLNGEYYASMIFNHMIADGLKVFVPTDIPHFCQWGTPEDLKEYLFWASTIKGFAS